jgi:hypothetical protein
MIDADKIEKPKKYFLYVDILGFSSLVMQDRIGDLYRRLDSLNAHNHDSFNTIVFSDTILIYNKDDLDWDEADKTALVSRLCEFASDLFHRLISQDIHFRAYICCGEFMHSKMKHIEAFYGRALVQSYHREREIQCAGLFIENQLVSYISEFASDKYDEHSHYVHLMESLEEIRFEEGSYPIDWNLVGPIGLDVFLSYHITYLKNIHTHMSNMDLPPRVRVKYLSAWQMIQKRHRPLLDALERSNFDPRAVCEMDWGPVFARIGTADGYFE